MESKEILLGSLHVEMSNLLDSVSDLVKNIKRFKLENQESKLRWANEWVSNAGKIFDDVQHLSDRIMMGENFKEISLSESNPLTSRLIQLSNAINQITERMYEIINYDQKCRLSVVKLLAERKYNDLLTQHAIASKLLESRQAEIQQGEMRQKQEVIKVQEAELRKKMSSKAVEAHRKFLASLHAIKALESIEDDTVIASESFIDEATLVESQTPTGRKRRSRSLTRKLAGSVKKTIRRSVSFVHNYLEHHHHRDE